MDDGKKLKLNTKRTIYFGFSFFTILMLWQVYNFYCPLILEEMFRATFGAERTYSYIVGVVMALDNILALFMLPLFGNLSDKTHTRLGKRMPYIIFGTLVAIALFPFISLCFVWNSLVGVCIMMGLILIAMNIYRAPSVALMPDVTPKPLRAKANAIINFVGYLGAILGTVLTMIFNKTTIDPVTGSSLLVRNITIWPFVITSVFMLVALIVLVLKVRENKILEETREEMAIGETMSETNEVVSEDKPLSRADKRNLWLLIISVFLWYFSFNAVETFGSTYAKEILHTDRWGLVTTILAASSLITFLPCTKLVAKVGRKNCIIIGLSLLLAPILACFWLTNIYAIAAMFFIAGAGWAMVNVCSYPMVVEMSNNTNIGKFTGYYYSASQIAQSITPIAVGFILTWIGYKAFFPYAFTFMALALLTFVFIRVKKPAKTADSVTIEVSQDITIEGETKDTASSEHVDVPQSFDDKKVSVNNKPSTKPQGNNVVNKAPAKSQSSVKSNKKSPTAKGTKQGTKNTRNKQTGAKKSGNSTKKSTTKNIDNKK